MKAAGCVRPVLRFLSHYAAFFLVIAFAITCCTMLFVKTMAGAMDIPLTAENIEAAAKLTLANVAVLSLICTVIDLLRRRATISKPVKQITDAAQKIMAGDFSVRISPVRRADYEDSFNQIIDCFNKMAEELSGTETLRTDFIANVSHELKTPLAVMQNYAVMLRQPNLPEEKRVEYANSISDASRRLASLITNILKLNKLENQQIFPVSEEYDLSEQVCRCLLGFEDTWELKNIRIETHIEDGVTIRSDSELLSLVWNNLFSNAMKFTDPGGTVSVSLSAGSSDVTLRVADTGCGISREIGTRIFDKFYQGDTSHSTQGNGLGLALVKRIIDIIGGEISVESELGKGSVFTVKMRRVQGGKGQKVPC